MADINIFDSATPQSGEFFKFSNVGDAVQGTYIDKKSGTPESLKDVTDWAYKKYFEF
jgi:hypothetical protein